MFDGILRIARHVQHLDAGRAAPDRDRPQSTIIFNNTEILILIVPIYGTDRQNDWRLWWSEIPTPIVHTRYFARLLAGRGVGHNADYRTLHLAYKICDMLSFGGSSRDPRPPDSHDVG